MWFSEDDFKRAAIQLGILLVSAGIVIGGVLATVFYFVGKK